MSNSVTEMGAIPSGSPAPRYRPTPAACTPVSSHPGSMACNFGLAETTAGSVGISLATELGVRCVEPTLSPAAAHPAQGRGPGASAPFQTFVMFEFSRAPWIIEALDEWVTSHGIELAVGPSQGSALPSIRGRLWGKQGKPRATAEQSISACESPVLHGFHVARERQPCYGTKLNENL